MVSPVHAESSPFAQALARVALPYLAVDILITLSEMGKLLRQRQSLTLQKNMISDFQAAYAYVKQNPETFFEENSETLLRFNPRLTNSQAVMSNFDRLEISFSAYSVSLERKLESNETALKLKALSLIVSTLIFASALVLLSPRQEHANKFKAAPAA